MFRVKTAVLPSENIAELTGPVQTHSLTAIVTDRPNEERNRQESAVGGCLRAPLHPLTGEKIGPLNGHGFIQPFG